MHYSIKEIPNYPDYYADNLGFIYRLTSKGLGRLGTGISTQGYHSATVSSSRQYVHRLVAMTFLPEWDDSLQVNHKDSIRVNNNIENLEMVTAQENMRHGREVGNINNKGGLNGCAKLTDEQARFIKYSNIQVTELADRFSLCRQTITNIKSGRTWRHI